MVREGRLFSFCICFCRAALGHTLPFAEKFAYLVQYKMVAIVVDRMGRPLRRSADSGALLCVCSIACTDGFFLPGRPNVADLTVRRGLLSGRVIRVGAAGLFGLLVLTELIQRNLEQRVASWADIGWGTLGIILGVVSGIFCVCLIRVNRPS